MRALIVTLVLMTLAALPMYFRSRAASLPTKGERGLALAWLWLRRAVCFFAAALFLVCAVLLSYDVAIGKMPTIALLGVLVLLGIAWLCVHYARYGAGYSRYDFWEDKPLHEQRRKRYGWRW